MRAAALPPELTPDARLFAAPLPSPCFIMDAGRLKANVALLDEVQKATGARILLALKAFAAFELFPLLSRARGGSLFGVCASSVDEARLGREEFGGEVHAFAAAWSGEEIAELAGLADHVVFNSLAQYRKFAPRLASGARPIQIGLRLNPEHSEGAAAIYNPCAPGSRLGIRHREMRDLAAAELARVDGLHFHTLCEQDAQPLARTLDALENRFHPWLAGRKWLNFGGGHHITQPGYDLDLLTRLLVDWRDRYGCQIYLEPGEAVALNAGWLKCEVLDVVEADMPVAILDTSAACHMPDVLEMPYTPQVWYLCDGRPRLAGEPGSGRFTMRLAGKSCLAGDVIGAYAFARPLEAGDALLFADMAIYSMVKTTTFNGLRLPAIAVYDPQVRPALRVIREFGYADFKSRLS